MIYYLNTISFYSFSRNSLCGTSAIRNNYTDDIYYIDNWTRAYRLKGDSEILSLKVEYRVVCQ